MSFDMVIPYTFRKARYQSPNCHGYWVKFYCIFDGTSIYHFAHEYDMIENACLATDVGTDCTTFTIEILVDKNRHSEIFNEIEDYVSRSNHD